VARHLFDGGTIEEIGGAGCGAHVGRPWVPGPPSESGGAATLSACTAQAAEKLHYVEVAAVPLSLTQGGGAMHVHPGGPAIHSQTREEWHRVEPV